MGLSGDEGSGVDRRTSPRVRSALPMSTVAPTLIVLAILAAPPIVIIPLSAVVIALAAVLVASSAVVEGHGCSR